jgi:UbiA prenyltransferase family protein
MLRFLRALLVLGRVSNVPTVWSNCLAGWLLGGGGNRGSLPMLLAGATCLYIAGMFLNDAFDADFDRKHRKERPIPSGTIPVRTVWITGFVLLTAGVVCLFAAGKSTGFLGLLLATSVVLYDAVHKRTAISPVLMALCRFWLYLIAGSTGAQGLNGWVVADAGALAAYIVGLSYLARRESFPGPLRHWPDLFLAIPILVALVRGMKGYTEGVLLLPLILGLWILRCLRSTLWSAELNIGRTVSGLLAGIVLVDWVAVADAPRELGFVFIALFLCALLFQRFVPAT